MSISRILICLTIIATLLTVACNRTPPAPATAPTTSAEIKAVTGPDICQVQIWAATAFERANQRPDDKALLDRVAWNIAVDRVTKALLKDPKADREAVLKHVEEVLKDVYKTPKLAECKTP